MPQLNISPNLYLTLFQLDQAAQRLVQGFNITKCILSRQPVPILQSEC